jgi:hypothetical protein
MLTGSPPHPNPPPMGAREKISLVLWFMGSKREGFIRRILPPGEGERGSPSWTSITLIAIAICLKLFTGKDGKTMDRVLFKQRQMVLLLPGGEGRASVNIFDFEVIRNAPFHSKQRATIWFHFLRAAHTKMRMPINTMNAPSTLKLLNPDGPFGVNPQMLS